VIITLSLLSNRGSVVDIVIMEMCSTKHIDGSGYIASEPLKNATHFRSSLIVKRSYDHLFVTNMANSIPLFNG
jgi:hypothetical protein